MRNFGFKFLRQNKELVLLVVLAFFIRLIGISHSLPFVYNVDEPTVVRSTIMLRESLNPGHFDWPHFYYYINGIFYSVFVLFRALLGFFKLQNVFPVLWQDPEVFYLISRVVTTIFASLTLIPVYKSIRLFLSKQNSLLTVLNLSSAPQRPVPLPPLNGLFRWITSKLFGAAAKNLSLKEELNKELSKASLETLSIILYKNGVGRSLIDYIRGVNSSFTLRALSIRGLIEKSIDKEDSRRYIYKPTFELLSFMGVKSVEELPDYELVNKSIETAQENLVSELENDENF